VTDPPFVTAPSLTAWGFVHGFSTRDLDLGIDPTTPHHARLAASVGYDLAALRTCKQVHGAELLDGVSPELARASEADALIARAPGSAVGVRVADCVPVLLANPRTGAVAAVHAGWRGVVGGVIPRAIDALGGGAELLAAVGPAIGPCCFEVGEEVADQIAGVTSPAVVRPREGARPHVDLWLAARWQLVARGVQQIELVGGCTFCAPDCWHSFRRDGAQSGRMLAVIAATEPR